MTSEEINHRKRIDILAKHLGKDFYDTGQYHSRISDAIKEYANINNALVDKKFMDWLAKEAPEVNESLWNCIHEYESNYC